MISFFLSAHPVQLSYRLELAVSCVSNNWPHDHILHIYTTFVSGTPLIISIDDMPFEASKLINTHLLL